MQVKEIFPDAKGWKTAQTAQKKIDALADKYPDITHTVRAAVVYRPKSETFIAVVFLTDEVYWLSMGLIEQGFCVM